MSNHTYTIHIINGIPFIKTVAGELITTDIYMDLAKSIYVTAKTFQSTESKQSDVLLPSITREIFNIMSEATINKDTDSLNDANKCVYFLKSKDFPDCIKIGSTFRINDRTGEIKTQFNLSDDPQIILTITTPQYRRLEHLIHILLHPHHVTNEWYSEEQSMWFINSMQSILKDNKASQNSNDALTN